MAPSQVRPKKKWSKSVHISVQESVHIKRKPLLLKLTIVNSMGEKISYVSLSCHFRVTFEKKVARKNSQNLHNFFTFFAILCSYNAGAFHYHISGTNNNVAIYRSIYR